MPAASSVASGAARTSLDPLDRLAFLTLITDIRVRVDIPPSAESTAHKPARIKSPKEKNVFRL